MITLYKIAFSLYLTCNLANVACLHMVCVLTVEPSTLAPVSTKYCVFSRSDSTNRRLNVNPVCSQLTKEARVMHEELVRVVGVQVTIVTYVCIYIYIYIYIYTYIYIYINIYSVLCYVSKTMLLILLGYHKTVNIIIIMVIMITGDHNRKD